MYNSQQQLQQSQSKQFGNSESSVMYQQKQYNTGGMTASTTASGGQYTSTSISMPRAGMSNVITGTSSPLASGMQMGLDGSSMGLSYGATPNSKRSMTPQQGYSQTTTSYSQQQYSAPTITTSTTSTSLMPGTTTGGTMQGSAFPGSMAGSMAGGAVYDSNGMLVTQQSGGYAMQQSSMPTMVQRQSLTNTTAGSVISGGGAMAFNSAAGSRIVTGSEQRIVGEAYVTGTRVVGHEFGAQRVISVNSHIDESRAAVISERFVEHEVRVPKRIVREEIIEKLIVIPEKVVHEEIIDEVQMVREKVVEVAKTTIVEKTVEVPEYEYVEKLIEVPERIVQEKIREVPRIDIQERIVEVPRIIQQEKIVEVPEIQYRDVPYEKVVEVPQIQEQFVFKEVPIPQYIDKPVPEYFNVEVPVDIERNLPVPVEAITKFEFRMPKLRPRYNRVNYQVYLPRFVEVPVARELMAAEVIASAERYLQQLVILQGTAASLCEIENLAAAIMKADFKGIADSTDLAASMAQAWKGGNLQFQQMSRTTQQMSSNYPLMDATYPAGMQINRSVVNNSVGGTYGGGYASMNVSGGQMMVPVTRTTKAVANTSSRHHKSSHKSHNRR